MNVENKYKKILKSTLAKGVLRNDRTGTGCYSLFNQSLEWDLKKFPIMTSKKIYPKIFKTEFEWFINGETNISRFKKAGVSIWDNWADKSGELGPTYGHQLRNFNSQGFDQLTSLIDGINKDKDSRRHIISLWNPNQLHDMALPPCYLYFQFFVEGDQLNMFVVQRSGDLFLGIPYDIPLFSLLLLYVADKVSLNASKIVLNIVDAHIYSNHIDQVKEYINNTSFKLPDYNYNNGSLELINYKSCESIKANISI